MFRRRVRHLLLAAIVFAGTACGGSPANPDQFTLNLTPGEYFFGIATLGVPPNCGPGFKPQDVDMSSRVTLSRDGTDWVARSTTPADGTLELRFRGSAGPVLLSAAPIGGTVRGIVNHRDNATSSLQRSMTIPLTGDSATVFGTANDERDPVVLGTSSFALTFTRTANGATVTCQLATSLWFLQRN